MVSSAHFAIPDTERTVVVVVVGVQSEQEGVEHTAPVNANVTLPLTNANVAPCSLDGSFCLLSL